MDRVIFLVDMDAYFASVEQASNPVLRGKPVIVCGQGRTVVAAASYEARAWGVKTGMTLPEARNLCPGVIAVHGDHAKYTDTSLRIHKILLEHTDQVEAFSIDECFLDVTHLCRRGVPAFSIARAVKDRIRREIGVTCSIGSGPNKVVAKLASKMRKPDGFMDVRREDVPFVFSTLTVRILQGVGVGRKTAAALESLGIRTVGQLAEAPEQLLMNRFGIVGHYLRRIGRGEDDSPVRRYGDCDQAKSVGHSITLPRDTRDPSVLRSYLMMLSEKVGARLREDNLMGRVINVTVRYADFSTFGKQHRLSSFIRTGYDIYAAAWKVFGQFHPLKNAVRLLGVCLNDLVADDGQRFLLEEIEKRSALTAVVDAINRKYGGMTVKPSSVLIAENFSSRARESKISFQPGFSRSWVRKDPHA